MRTRTCRYAGGAGIACCGSRCTAAHPQGVTERFGKERADRQPLLGDAEDRNRQDSTF